MIVAELRGKLSSRVERSEDILTSNVFSFFKYAARRVYLRELMTCIGISPTNEELDAAEFVFWPVFDDGTEPDVVVLVGDYYLLFEAKYFAQFGEDYVVNAGQFSREVRGGEREAKNHGRYFVLVAITADYTYPKQYFAEIITKNESNYEFKWVNWQAIAGILLNVLEEYEEQAPDYFFAYDLYQLLDRKRLRGFLSFARLEGVYPHGSPDSVFFSSQSAKYSGDFIGFRHALRGLSHVEQRADHIFFNNAPEDAAINWTE